jgi:hypothetical protein
MLSKKFAMEEGINICYNKYEGKKEHRGLLRDGVLRLSSEIFPSGYIDRRTNEKGEYVREMAHHGKGGDKEC